MAAITSGGITVTPPAGWDARIYRRTEDGTGERTHWVLHAANFALPAERGDFGSGAVELMGPENVLVVLIEYGADGVGQPLFARARPPVIDVNAFSPQGLQRTIPGQGGMQAFFTEADRPWCLYVVVGSYASRVRLARQADALLATLRIGAGSRTVQQ